MNLWQHPRRVWTACAAVVLACAAAPAVFLAAVDASALGRREPVAEPYTAPTPQGEDYYILRQLSARKEQQELDGAGRTDPLRPEGPGPKMYIQAQNGLEEMTPAYDQREVVESALQNLAAEGVLAARWVDWATDWGDGTEDTAPAVYESYNGYYDLTMPYYATDSLGFVTLKRFALEEGALYTAFSMTMDSRTGAVTQLWISAPREGDTAPPAPDADALRAFAAQAGLEALGDWAVPENCPYPNALYSRNGEALIAAAVAPYRFNGWNSVSAAGNAVSSDRWALNLTLQPCAPEELPQATP